MKRITVLFLTVMLVVGIAGLTQAKKEKPAALATITALGCGELLEGGIISASWSWVEDTETPPHTKFGGDAVFNVDVYIGDADPITVALDFELVKLDPLVDDLPTVYAGKMPYSCDDALLCTGVAFKATNEFIGEALAGMFPNVTITFDPPDFSDEVWVKAMNPGVDNGRQNYPLTNVCD